MSDTVFTFKIQFEKLRKIKFFHIFVNLASIISAVFSHTELVPETFW